MLNEDGVAREDVEEYLRDWGLASDGKAARAIAFFTEPSSRIYVSTYSDGRRLCKDYVERAPENFTRLLTEQLTVADIRRRGLTSARERALERRQEARREADVAEPRLRVAPPPPRRR